MKKFVCSFFITLFIIGYALVVKGTDELSFELSVDSTEIERGSEFVVGIRVNNFTRPGTNKSIMAKLNYQGEKIEYKSIHWEEDWEGSISTDKTGLSAMKTENVEGSELVAEITFKVAENAEIGSTGITITSIETSSDGDRVEASEYTKPLTIIEKSVLIGPMDISKQAGTDSVFATINTTKETIEVSGVGQMKDFGQTDTVLDNYRQMINKVIIKDGVTNLGANACYNFTNLEKVVIPRSVAQIGDNAFYGCNNLVIYCYDESYAKNYAIENNIPYVLIEDATLENLIILKKANKRRYVEHTNFNTEGIKIKAVYDNGEEKEIENYEIINGTNLYYGQERVTIKYTEGETIKEIYQTIEVVKRGDANKDGVIDFKDLLVINKHRLNKVTLVDVLLETSDVTGDGIVDFKDILKINKYRLGKISNL